MVDFERGESSGPSTVKFWLDSFAEMPQAVLSGFGEFYRVFFVPDSTNPTVPQLPDFSPQSIEGEIAIQH